MNRNDRLNKISGCMIGGAAGDALGYPVEFNSYKAIMSNCKKDALRDYILINNNDVALISDDTQMTIFTANGLMNNCFARTAHYESSTWVESVAKAYRKWLNTQLNCYSSRKGEYEKNEFWVYDRQELWSQRAPGNTCIHSLSQEELGSLSERINKSRGCGGVMRVAPVGLILPYYSDNYDFMFDVGSRIAALTHGHIDGWAPAGMLAVIIAQLMYNTNNLMGTIEESIRVTNKFISDFPDKNKSTLLNKVSKAVSLALNSTDSDIDNIRCIGDGWVGDEALAISIYCALKHKDNFEDAIASAVSHGGDSDSTGAITGNIVGTLLGYSNIPDKFKDNLECKDILLQLSSDMATDIASLSRRYNI